MSRDNDFRITRGRFDFYLIENLEIQTLKFRPYFGFFGSSVLWVDPRGSGPRFSESP